MSTMLTASSSIVSNSPVRVSVHATPLVQAGIAGLLEAHAHRVVLVSSDEPDAPEVALVDLLGAASDRPSRHPRIPTVLLVPDPRKAREIADRLGAVRVLPLSVEGPAVVRALEEARDRGPELLQDRHPDVLSPREADVLGLIQRGLSNEEIAAELYLSLNTVKSHIRSTYRKLGVTTRAQAVIWSFTHGS